MVVTLTQSQLATALAGNAARVGVLFVEAQVLATADATRLLPVVVEMVDHYAPAAPDAISNEAAIRVASHISQQPADARSSESYDILGVSFEVRHATSAISPLRASGAMALLSPYKVRRGGAI